ncbi:MAG TPA: alpha/beta hydrolase [Caulobacteraceae bacterium]|nr:alpha/beta hydrolase [Caulobacteraceae bacterium]
MRRRGFLLSGLAAGCAPTVQRALPPAPGVRARFEADRFVSFDGARLGLTSWTPTQPPWAVIVGLHGMNDYANAFHMAAPYWAERGIATYAYDQRGFGRSPNRGVWAGEALMAEDLRTAVLLARGRHPGALVAVVGESMGGAVAINAFASEEPPAADRLVLLAPAVWGWSNQPLPNRMLLWLGAHVLGAQVVEPPEWITRNIRASDNTQELMAMGRDPLMIWGARNDAIYGLVQLMEKAWLSTGRLRVPTAWLYGANDQIIPPEPTIEAAARLHPAHRTAYYKRGWHLLLRDLQARKVWEDVASFIADPSSPWPSGAPPIPLGSNRTT